MSEREDQKRKIQSMIETMQQIEQMMRPIAKSPLIREIQQIQQKIQSLIPVKILREMQSFFSKERRNEIIESFKKWGRFGWTILPEAPICLFYSCPENSHDADKIALSYCKKEQMKNLFIDLRTKSIKNKDLDEAIFSYENRKYLACALVLFGIIEAKIIRLQPPGLKTNKGWRHVGHSAIREYNEIFKSKNSTLIENKFIMAFIFYNLRECLLCFFANTEDFKLKSNLINRNYIGHGMHKKRVRKKDCIQLFLALHNFLILLDNA